MGFPERSATGIIRQVLPGKSRRPSREVITGRVLSIAIPVSSGSDLRIQQARSSGIHRLPNHWHILVLTDDLKVLTKKLGRLHGKSSFQWNREEAMQGRKCWSKCADRSKNLWPSTGSLSAKTNTRSRSRRPAFASTESRSKLICSS